MASLQRLVITSNGSALDFISQCNLKPLGLDAVNSFSNYIQGLSGGNEIGASLAFKVGAVQAAGTIAFASTGPANAQTATLFGVTWTALTSGQAAGSANFDRNNDLAIASANLASQINAYVPFQGMVSAVAGATGVTVTSAVPGKIGNGLFMVNVNWANTTITTLASGTDGTAYNIDLR